MSDLASVIAAISSGIAAIIAALALYKVRQTHDLVNSRTIELLRLTATAAHAEGVIEGNANASRVPINNNPVDPSDPPTDAPA